LIREKAWTQELVPGQRTERPKISAAETFLQDLRYAARVLTHNPGFSGLVIAILALGIGANTAIFTLVNAVLLTPVPVPDPDKVVTVWNDKINAESGNYRSSIPDFLDWRATGVFQELAGFSDDPDPPYNRTGCNLLVGDRVERVSLEAVSSEWFEILKIQPQLGRVFRKEDMSPGRNHVAILTDTLWHARFAADPNIIGKTIFLNGSPYTVIGVLPKRVPKLAAEELYVPFYLDPSSTRALRFLGVVGRLTPGTTLAAAQGALNGLNDRLRKEYPVEDGAYRPRLQPIEETYVENVHTLMLVLFGAVVFVLLIACANVGNLMLIRATTRQREIAIRVALGAGRLRLIRQLLTESLLLAFLGGVAGIIPAVLGIHFLAKIKQGSLPNADLITLNPKVLLFTLLVAMASGVLFGLVPAWDAWRSKATSPLRERAPGFRSGIGNAFVVTEVALSVVLVSGAILMLRSFIQLRSTYPGYDSRVLSMRVSLVGTPYDAPDKQTYFYREVLRRLATLPGVRAVGAIDCLPTCNDVYGGAMHFTDRPDPSPSDPALVMIGSITPEYLRAMNIPLLHGRYFSEADGEHDPLVAILDQGTAQRYWPHQDPIGRNVRFRRDTPLRRIVGVVGNIDHPVDVKAKSPIGQVYVPAPQLPHSDMSLVVSSPMNSASLIPVVRRTISTFAPEVPVFQIETMGEARAATQRSSKFGASLLGLFASLSVLLAAVGVYGVMSYAVAQRTREIGVRMAVGATASRVLFHTLSRGLMLTGLGLVVGFVGALGLTTTMSDLLNGVSARDPVSLLLTMLLLLAVALLATSLPADRASRVEPMSALRYE
jgi:predicted permease